MPLPIDNLTSVHLDAATDDPSQARVEILALLNKVKEIIAVLDDGAGGGVNADFLRGFGAAITPGANIIPVHDAGGRLRIGNIVGIGTAPDADHDPALVSAALEIGEYGLLYHRNSGGGVEIIRNAKLVSGAWVYGNSGEEAQFLSFDNDGAIKFLTAPAATAGSAVSFVLKLLIPNAAGAAMAYEGNAVWHAGSTNDYNSHPVSGYVRVGTGIYRKSSAGTGVSLSTTLQAIAAPAGAKGLILSITCDAVSQNAIADRYTQVQVYSDAAGTIITGSAEAVAREFSALPAQSLGRSVTELIAPVISGNAYAKIIGSTTGATASYRIVGYTV